MRAATDIAERAVKRRQVGMNARIDAHTCLRRGEGVNDQPTSPNMKQHWD